MCPAELQDGKHRFEFYALKSLTHRTNPRPGKHGCFQSKGKQDKAKVSPLKLRLRPPRDSPVLSINFNFLVFPKFNPFSKSEAFLPFPTLDLLNFNRVFHVVLTLLKTTGYHQ